MTCWLNLVIRATAILAVAYSGVLMPMAKGGLNSYTITLDTSILVGRSGGPFSVAFYLTDGSGLGDGNNTVTLSGFDFGGGSAQGNIIKIGGASGSLASSVNLTDSLFFNSLIQQFTPGARLAFVVSASSNVDTSTAPDLFAVSIIDGTGQPLPTQGSQPFFSPLASITFNSANPSVQNDVLISKLLEGAVNAGSMAHIASADTWATTFTLVNTGAASAQARLNLFGDDGSPLLLPLDFPQLPASGTLLESRLDRTIAANATLLIDTTGPGSQPVQVGSTQLVATGAPTSGFAIFRLNRSNQEAVVPLETRNAGSYLLAFDNTNGVVLGVALQNISAQASNVPVVIRDDTGAQIGTGTVALPASGHTSFVLSTQFPITSNKRGTIEFDTPPGGKISALGIRTTPLGSSNTFTTIPALANIATSGGSIAHIATGNGWQTTFVLVNAGTSSAQAHLDFFADGGGPLPLPISFPQSGGTTTVTASVNQTLAAGAMLMVRSAGPLSDPAPTIGSAQLTTNGNVGGFVIFRYNPNGQEAVVPLENRGANAYILAFDNTNGTGTGVAINSVSAQSVSIPVVVRDEAGTQIATDAISLAANGHLAFTLGVDKYPATANIRGTIEFDTPAGGQISVLGIRIPPAHTFTTLPALVK